MNSDVYSTSQSCLSCSDINPPQTTLQKAFKMLTVLMNKLTMELKMALVAFQIQANQVYLRHVTHRIIKPENTVL